MRIGICGGTFDPFHRGHLDPILAVREQMRWDRIYYVPAYRQPFKLEDDTASGYHRFAMAVLATEDLPDLRVLPLELERGAISYTVETLEQLRRAHPADTLDWIIGDDNVADLGRWKDIDRIFELANFVVLSRKAQSEAGVEEALDDDDDADEVADDEHDDEGAMSESRACGFDTRPEHGCLIYAANETVPISATEIRERVREGLEIDAFVDPRVSRYIQQNRLYQGVLA